MAWYIGVWDCISWKLRRYQFRGNLTPFLFIHTIMLFHFINFRAHLQGTQDSTRGVPPIQTSQWSEGSATTAYFKIRPICMAYRVAHSWTSDLQSRSATRSQMFWHIEIFHNPQVIQLAYDLLGRELLLGSLLYMGRFLFTLRLQIESIHLSITPQYWEAFSK